MAVHNSARCCPAGRRRLSGQGSAPAVRADRYNAGTPQLASVCLRTASLSRQETPRPRVARTRSRPTTCSTGRAPATARRSSGCSQRHLRPLQRWASGRLPAGPAIWPTPTTLSRTPCSRRLRGSRTSSLAASGALQAYLRQAVLNRIRDELRRKRRQPPSTDRSRPSSSQPRARRSKQAIGREAVGRTSGARAAAGRTSARPSSRGSRWATLRGARRGARQADAGRGPQGGAAGAGAPGGGDEACARTDARLSPTWPAAILDGTPIDWAAAESSADDGRAGRCSASSSCSHARRVCIVGLHGPAARPSGRTGAGTRRRLRRMGTSARARADRRAARLARCIAPGTRGSIAKSR